MNIYTRIWIYTYIYYSLRFIVSVEILVYMGKYNGVLTMSRKFHVWWPHTHSCRKRGTVARPSYQSRRTRFGFGNGYRNGAIQSWKRGSIPCDSVVDTVQVSHRYVRLYMYKSIERVSWSARSPPPFLFPFLTPRPLLPPRSPSPLNHTVFC
jgi:hypothetical protein